ncbi:MAG: metallophosphoesterase [Cognaticolwellia sp.]
MKLARVKFPVFLTLLVTLLIINVINRTNASEPSDTLYSDGPYVSIDKTQLHFDWLCENQHKSRSIARTDLPFHFNQCQLTANIDRVSFIEEKLEFTTTENIAAVSDFHGQLALMTKILSNNGIIDQQGDWAFGRGHLVITGDVFDRGDKVTEILWFLYQLEQQAELVGGKVHLLLGNHEVMVLNNDLRYIHDKYQASAELMNKPFAQLYGKNTLLGQWLRSKPVLVKINNMLFVHGGLHPELAKQQRSLSDINDVFKANLVKTELAAPRTGWGKYLHKGDGPIWYRGYFKPLGASSEEITMLLTHFNIDHIVVGHTSQAQVETRHQGRVIAIDSSIKKGQYGELLIVENGQHFRGLPEGEKQTLIAGE